MHNRAWLVAATVLLLSGTVAWADDKSECLNGIRSIKTAIAKKPPQATLESLKRALDSAQQEEIEQDWDECVAAVKQAPLSKK
jgi:hypothetical protein